MDFLKLPGYSDFAPKIFASLDLHTLISCKLVCQSWFNFINQLYPDLISLKRRLATLDVRQKAIFQYDDLWSPPVSLSESLKINPFPWSPVFQHFERKENVKSLKYLINFLEDYMENRAEFEGSTFHMTRSNPLILQLTSISTKYQPIRYAIYNDNLKFLKILLCGDAPINWNLEKPFEFAWDNLKLRSIEFLLEHFDTLKLKVSFPGTFLMDKFVLLEKPIGEEYYQKLVKYLLEYPTHLEVDLNAVDLFGNVFLKWAIWFFRGRRERPKILKMILNHFVDHNIDVTGSVPEGESILEYAERCEMSDVLNIFHEFGFE